jgi:DNA-binding MarR family transcriptional regulator
MNEKNIISLISSVRDRANKFILDELSAKGIKDLAPSHGAILACLYKNGGKVKMNELAKSINRDKSTLTALVNKLHNLGYVKKSNDDCDKRVTYVSLTKRGDDIKDGFFEISKKLLDAVYCGFSDEEKYLLAKLLNKIKI